MRWWVPRGALIGCCGTNARLALPSLPGVARGPSERYRSLRVHEGTHLALFMPPRHATLVSVLSASTSRRQPACQDAPKSARFRFRLLSRSVSSLPRFIPVSFAFLFAVTRSDAARTAGNCGLAQESRHGSFAPPRPRTLARWLVDGAARLKARRRSHESPAGSHESPASVRGLGRRCAPARVWSPTRHTVDRLAPAELRRNVADGVSSTVCILKRKAATSAPGPACRARVLQRGVQRADARARGNLHHGLVDLPAAVPPAAGQAGAAAASVSLSAFTAQRRRAIGSGDCPLLPICPSPPPRLRMRRLEPRGAGFAIRLPCDLSHSGPVRTGAARL